MKRVLKVIAAVLLAGLAVVAVFGPFGPVPGVFIGGTPTAAPNVWPDTSKVDEVLLRIPGALPRVVTIWVVNYQGDLYVVGASDAGWVGMIGRGLLVNMRIGDNTYELYAEPVTDKVATVQDAYLAKYRPNYPDITATMATGDDVRSRYTVYRLARR